MRRFRQSSRGFTLIEILVVLALMALISTILLTSLHFAGRSWQAVTRSTANAEAISMTQTFLRDRLETIYPYEQRSDDVSAPGFVASDGRSLEFSAPAPRMSADGILRYEVSVTRDDSSKLRIRWRRDRNGLPDTLGPQWSEEVLLEGVERISFQFLEGSDGTPQWAGRWTDRQKLPRLIRVDVIFPDGDRRRWPPLYVEPRVDADANCEFDPVSRRCRMPT